MSLSPEQVQAYHRDGFLSGLPVSGAAEAARFRERFDELEAEEGRERCQIGLIDRHFDRRFIWDLATLPAILDAVESLVGPDLLLLATHFFCKYGPTEKWVAWHQDLTYWGLDPPEAVTAWYAIDDSDSGNGCMRALPGTHAGGIREHGKAAQGENLLSINQEAPVAEAEERSAIDLELAAGQISLHHGALIHGSPPNRSERRRCGVTLRYVSPEVRPIAANSMGRGWNAVPVRGEDRYRHFGERQRPF